MLPRDGAQVIHTGGDIPERPGPSTTWVAHPPVFECPRGDARPRQRVGERRNVIEGEVRAPAAAMQNDDDRMRSVTARQPQVAELERIVPVRNAHQRLRIRPLQRLLDADERRLHDADTEGQRADLLGHQSSQRPVTSPRTSENRSQS